MHNQIILKKDLFGILGEGFVVIVIATAILIHSSQSGSGVSRGPGISAIALILIPIYLAYNIIVSRFRKLIFIDTGIHDNMSIFGKKIIKYKSINDIVFGGNHVTIELKNSNKIKFMHCDWTHNDKVKILKFLSDSKETASSA